MNGVLVIDKPSGPTSFGVVQRVRSLLKVNKAGHTGTLDPNATGVLPICVGAATKLAGLLAEGKKAYLATIRFGIETDTQDAAGQKIAEAPVPELSNALLESALSSFRGSIMQVPPMHSAVKVGGKRLYQLARAGEHVSLQPRPVTVDQLALLDFSSNEATVSITCSKGFFVRSLAHDLGRALGCGGHLKTLRRTASGPFTLQQAITLDRMVELCRQHKPGAEQLGQHLIPTADAVRDLPAIRVSAQDAIRVSHGVPIEWPAGAGRVRVLGPDDSLLAIAELGKGPRLKYYRVLV
ncbi:MAG TPA: tRNA pseudouridine(55) synthase TruB [Myxococcaceae bacterium]|nr:tRNA pseudouridine(55) synthase TruB [Myxococcaceae bacterium]